MLAKLLLPDVVSSLRSQIKDEEPLARLIPQSRSQQGVDHRRSVDPELERDHRVANREVHRSSQQSDDLRDITLMGVYHRTSYGGIRQRLEIQQTSGRSSIEERAHSGESS